MILRPFLAALTAVLLACGGANAATTTAATAQFSADFQKTNSPTQLDISASGTFEVFTDLDTVRDYTLTFSLSGTAFRASGGTFNFSKSDTFGPESFALNEGEALLANFFPVGAPGVSFSFSNTLFNSTTGVGSADLDVLLTAQPALDALNYIVGATPDFLFTGTLTVDAELTYAEPVPVPASLPLLACAMGGLAWRARRQKRNC